ncbi:hypothetical protein FRC01_004929 [Tulasnella sp. 417]|nr:hypothetical protein FRC01_004929 [Tulasnella sp. 417]
MSNEKGSIGGAKVEEESKGVGGVMLGEFEVADEVGGLKSNPRMGIEPKTSPSSGAKLPVNINFPPSPVLPLKNGSSPAPLPNDSCPKSGCTTSNGVVKPPPPPPAPNPAVDRDEDAAESGGVSKLSKDESNSADTAAGDGDDDDGGGWGDKLGGRNVKLHASLKWF